MFNSVIFLPIIIAVGMVYSILAKKLTVPAAGMGAILACLIYFTAGYTGVAMMTAFFILGAAATSWQWRKKQDAATIAEIKNGRNALQVLANVGAAGMVGVIISFYPSLTYLMLPAMAAAFAAATADTLSSELGMLYGKRFYNVISFKPDRCGMDGVISLEGTMIGILASSIIAGIYAIGYGWNMNFCLIIIAGTVGNLTDSVMGAVLERKGIIGNNMVNFVNTLIAAVVVLVMEIILI